MSVLILVANSLGLLHKRLCRECRQGGSSCGGPRYGLQPCRDAHEVERGGGEHVLQTRVGVTEVATRSSATPPDGLRLRALNPGPRGILRRELGRLLSLPCGLDRLVRGLRPDGELARGIVGLGARLADRTRPAAHRLDTEAHHEIAGDLSAWPPSNAGLPLRTGGRLRLPGDAEGAQIIAWARSPWVARRPEGWAHDLDLMDGRSGDEPLGIDIATIEQVQTGEEMALGQVTLHERAHGTIRGGRQRGHDTGAQVRLIILTGVGQVHLGADPGGATRGAIPGLAILGGGDPRGCRQPLLHRSPAEGSRWVRVLLGPDLPSWLNGRDFLEPRPLRCRLDRVQELATIGADGCRQGLTRRGGVGHMVVLQAAAITVDPGGRDLGLQPGWGDDSEAGEGVAAGLTDEFQPVEDPDGRQHVRGVRTWTAAPVEETTFAHPGAEGSQPQAFGLSGAEPGPELTQHGVVDAGSGHLPAQGIVPVKAAAPRIRRLAVGPAVGTRQDRRQRQAPGRLRWLPTGRKAGDEERIIVNGAEFVTHPHRAVAAGEGGLCDAAGRFGNGRDRLRAS
jgi:hypothetical protein